VADTRSGRRRRERRLLLGPCVGNFEGNGLYIESGDWFTIKLIQGGKNETTEVLMGEGRGFDAMAAGNFEQHGRGKRGQSPNPESRKGKESTSTGEGGRPKLPLLEASQGEENLD